MKYLIGVDLGTSATKTIMIDSNGKIVSSALHEYPLYQPQNGWAEQEPEDWKKAVISTIREVTAKSNVPKDEIVAIGLSGQMHGLVMLDELGNPLGRSIIWCDQRTEKQVEEMLKMLPLSKWMEITANPPIAAWTAAKILWTRENEPDKYKKCKHILLPKDYVRYVLTGEFATDVSDASGMQLLNVKKRCWSDVIVNKLGIDKSLLGKVYESEDIVGNITPKIADECGLSTKTMVIAGASDNAAAALGTGIVRNGQAFTSIGTSAIVYTHLDNYVQVPEGSLHVCCSAVPGCWHTMGGPQAAGLSLEWFKNNFCKDMIEEARMSNSNIYTLINDRIKYIPIGSDKLIYLPFLMGERTPHMDAEYRAAFIGLNSIHSKEHMLRAIMEGVTYSLSDCNDILKKLGVNVNTMRVCGGGSRSPVWRSIMANLYKCNVKTLKNEEGPAYGIAILAGVTSGVFNSIQEACDNFIIEDSETCYDAKKAALYEKYHMLYDKVYGDLKEDFGLLFNINL